LELTGAITKTDTRFADGVGHRLPALPRVHGRPDAEYDIAEACLASPPLTAVI